MSNWIIRVALSPIVFGYGHAVIQVFKENEAPNYGFVPNNTNWANEFYSLNGYGTDRITLTPNLVADRNDQLLGYLGSVNGSEVLGTIYTPSQLGPGSQGVILSNDPSDYQTVFVGSENEVKEKLYKAAAVQEYIENQNIAYDVAGPNSNSVANAFLKAMGITTWDKSAYPGANEDILPDGFQALADIGYQLNGHTILTNQAYIGGGGDDILIGGIGDNTLIGRSGDNVLDGAAGRDTTDYSMQALMPDDMQNTVPTAAPVLNHITVYFSSSAPDVIVHNPYAGIDILRNIEIIKGMEGDKDTIVSDLDLRSIKGGYQFGTKPTLVNFIGIEHYIATDSNQKIYINKPEFTNIDTGAGADTVFITGSLSAPLTVNTGAGEDIIKALSSGTVLYTGADDDVVELAGNIYVMDMSAADRLTFMGIELHGGVRYAASEDPLAYGSSGIGYGLNQQGDLVVQSVLRGSDGSALPPAWVCAYNLSTAKYVN